MSERAASDVLPQREELLRKLFVLAAGIAMVLSIAYAYAPAKDAGLVWDDHILVAPKTAALDTPISRLIVSPFWPETPFADARAPYYRPLVVLSLRLDHARRDGGGLTAADFHRTNVALHVLSAIFLAVVAVRLRARPFVAIAAALLWALAPRLTESVVWISGRTDVLAGMFGLAALALCPDIAEKAAGRLSIAVRSVLTGLLLFAALCSKEVAIAFAIAIVLGAWRGGGLRERASLARLAAYVGLPVLTWAALRHVALEGKSVALRDLGAGRRAATVLEALARYVEMTFDALRPRTSIGMLGEVEEARAVVGGVIVVALIALFIKYRRAAGSTVVCGALGLASVGAVLHIVPFTLAGSVTADRLLYIPLAALAIGGAVGVSTSRPMVRRVAAGLAVGVALLFGRATTARAHEYRDEMSFWVIAAEHAHPHNTMPLSLLAGLVNDVGDVDLACRLYGRAATVLGASERAGLAAHRRTRENLAACWARSGRYDDALRLSEELAREYPDAARIQLALGFARLHVRDFDGAMVAFSRPRGMDANLHGEAIRALHDAATGWSEWQRLQAPEARRAAPFAWAEHLAHVGRPPEASAAFLAVALSPEESPAHRQSAIEFLVVEGSIDDAERARQTSPAGWSDAMITRLAERRTRREPLRLLRPRIEVLAR